MNRLSPWRRTALAAAPVFGSLALALYHWRTFGTGDRADSLLGMVVGIGVGVTIAAAFGLRRRCL